MVHKGRISRGWRRGMGVFAAVGIALAGASLLAAPAGGPSLGAARSFAVLAGSSVANTGATSVTGDVGVSPGTSITGFSAVDGGPGIVTGGAFHAGDATAAAAQSAVTSAFNALAAMASGTDLTGTDLGGLTLLPGVYSFTSTAQLTGVLRLDADCNPAAVFVFQIGTTLTTAASSSVVVINGGADYDESNVFWQVGSAATLGASNAFTGNILAQTTITIGAGSTMTGNALARDGAVTLDSDTITSPPLVVDTTTMAFTPYSAQVTDVKDAPDVSAIYMTYAYTASPDGRIDPRVEGMTIGIAPAGETTPLSLAIPPDDAAWALAGNTWNWSKTVEGVLWRVSVDDVSHLFSVYAGGFTLSPGDGAGALWGGPNADFHCTVSITCGNDSGIDVRCWRNSKQFNSVRNWGVLRSP